jgi:hypothetical protein
MKYILILLLLAGCNSSPQQKCESVVENTEWIHFLTNQKGFTQEELDKRMEDCLEYYNRRG